MARRTNPEIRFAEYPSSWPADSPVTGVAGMSVVGGLVVVAGGLFVAGAGGAAGRRFEVAGGVSPASNSVILTF